MSRNPFIRHGLAGMASYQMDTDINIDVNEGSEEAAIEEAETDLAEEEAATASEEVAETVEETMKLLAMLDTYESFKAVVTDHGISRPVMELMLAYDMDPESLGVPVVDNVPKCEDFSVVGSIYSEQTVACLEGIESSIASVVKWILEKCKQFADFIIKLFNIMGRRVKSLEGKHASLSKSFGSLTKKGSAEGEVKVYDDATVHSLVNTAKGLSGDDPSNSPDGIVKKVAGWFGLGRTSTKGERRDDPQLKTFAANVQAFKKHATVESRATSVTRTSPTTFLDGAKNLLEVLNKFLTKQKNLEAINKKTMTTAKTAQSGSDEEKKKNRDVAKALVAYNGQIISNYNTALSSGCSAVKQMLSMASAIMAKGYEAPKQ